MAAVSNESKPGTQTTEFWVHNGVTALIWVSHAAQAGQLPLKFAVIAQSILSIGYAVSRGFAKSGVPA